MRGAPLTRRVAIGGAGSAALALAVRPVSATPDERDAALAAFANGAVIRPGRVHLDMPPLVENGNAAPLTVTVESPMSEADHVVRIGLFNERNPQPQILTAQIGPRAGRAQLSTRIRLATSQRIVAVAEMSDGTCWSGEADVIVTLAACVEG